MRQAIALLVQHPQLAQTVAERDAVAALQQPGADLLQRVLGYLDEHSSATTGQILEHFRDSADAGPLGKLAALNERLIDDEERDLETEFRDVLRRLRQQDLESRIQALGERGQALTPEEKKELMRLHEAKKGLLNG